MPFFPATESTLSASHLAIEIQRQYKLKSPVTCKLLRTGMNHLYRVSTAEDEFVFRVYTFGWRTRREISKELRLLRLLKENGVSVAYPVVSDPNTEILTFSAPEGIRYGVLFSFAFGKKDPRFSKVTSFYIGRTMAQMHDLTANLNLERVTYSADVLLDDSFAFVSDFFGIETEEMRYLGELRKMLKQRYTAVNTSRLRKGVVHFDLWFDNMHIREEDQITLFDFDFCGNVWLIHDVAYFLFQLFATNSKSDYEEKYREFMKGYAAIHQPSSEEMAFLPYAGLGMLLFYLGVQCRTFETWSNIFLNDDHLKRFVGSLKRWAEHHQLVLGNAASAGR